MPVINATVPNTLSGNLQILHASAFLAGMSAQNDRKFLLDLIDAVNLNIGGTSHLELDDTEYTVPLGRSARLQCTLGSCAARYSRARGNALH